MAIPFAKFPENSLNFKKINRNTKNQDLEKTDPNLKSFWAFLSSILIYICVFYIFNLSPSTLICTTKFWFIISNTLVLIAAVDFAAFLSAKRHDSHDMVKYTTITSPKSNMIISSYEEQMIIKDTSATSPKGGAVVPFEATTSHNSREEENSKERITNTNYDRHEKKRRKCARSNSENAAAVVAEEEGKTMVLHRTLSETHDCEDHGSEDEKIDEFSRMSNEELNARVEEFIRRFNKQIRLQAVMNPQNLEMNKIH